ncbi:MAG: ParB/RepB/Spo0J family partition protein [Cyanobacteria bacterium]|nr:ParB/RepB/Spo0J family partition protein [Cyanobacteriota bacterium]MDW8199612.1 ParB/RepB/Spo0J family partition protein [Cyanobacteriota bacterium SKYGB_h_bin112]
MTRKRDQPFRQIKAQGLDALFGDAPPPAGEYISLDQIVLPAQQPRRYFDPHKMAQLVQSVKTHGILEPLIVRPLPDGRYELVAGERRYRAAREVGLTEVPIVKRDLTDQEAQQFALVENLQREDLNPVEETEGILHLLAINLNCEIADVSSLLYRMNNAALGNIKEESNHNVMISDEATIVQDVFQGLGLMSWESFVRNRLPLLKLPEDVLEALRQGQLAYTKAKEIARIKDSTLRQELLQTAIAEDLSLADIRTRIAERMTKLETTPPSSLKQRFKTIVRQVSKSNLWDDPKKSKQLEKLLSQLEAML